MPKIKITKRKSELPRPPRKQFATKGAFKSSHGSKKKKKPFPLAAPATSIAQPLSRKRKRKRKRPDTPECSEEEEVQAIHRTFARDRGPGKRVLKQLVQC